MKRSILAGAVALVTLAAGASSLWAQKPPAAKTKAEGQAVQALGAAQAKNDPDEIIKAADELVTKFADTEFKEAALALEARAYQMKGDSIKAQIYAERVLEVNPANIDSEMMLGEILAQTTGDHDLDKEEKLARAEKYLGQSIGQLKAAPKPPQLTDQQWETTKAYTIAEAHQGLGMIAEVRKKFDIAATEYKTAADGDPQVPTYSARLARALQLGGKNDEAIGLCNKILEDKEKQLNQQVRDYVQKVRADAIKAGGKAPEAK